MEQLFNKYLNIQVFLIKYRNYKLEDNDHFLDIDGFKNKIQLTGYVQHSLTHNVSKENIDIYIFKHDSKFIKTTIEFNKILDRYNEKKLL